MSEDGQDRSHDLEPRKRPELRRLIVKTVIVFAASLALYLGYSIYSGLADLTQALRQIGLLHLAWMIAVVLLGWLARGGRWVYFSARREWQIPVRANLLAFAASFAFTATPGKMGELIKSWLLQDAYATPMSQTAGALLIERLQDLLAVLLLASFGLRLLKGGSVYFVGCLVILCFVTAFLLTPRLYRAAFTRLGRLRRLARAAARGRALFDSARQLLAARTFALSFAIALFSWAGEATVLHGILSALSIPTPLWTSFSVYGLATLVGALSMLPGGIGGFEAAMLLLLHGSFDTPQPTATAATLLIRTLTLWLVNLLGFVFLIIWLRRPKTSR